MTRRSYSDALGGTVRRFLAPFRRASAPSHRFPVDRALGDSFLDALEVESSGLLRLKGWTRHDPAEFASSMTLRVNGKALPSFACYRLHRPDVAKDQGWAGPFLGVAVEFMFRPLDGARDLHLAIEFAGTTVWEVDSERAITVPAYDGLFDESRVLHREDIYGYGPPSREVSAEVVALVQGLAGPVLDFGCGAGALIRELRARGLEAHGLELDRPEIAAGMLHEARPFIRLYRGEFPAPYPDKSFPSVTCVEVLEHIPSYREAVAEIARIARNTVVFTVPDIGAIPLCHEHHVVPWHLLESTHLNFFTQKSLGDLLRGHFRRVEMVKIGPVQVNGTTFYTSLAAICEAHA